jgi:rhodanese-related sulfurtransferase
VAAAERVDVRTARAMQQAGDTIVDVRRPEEYASGHIAGAINIPIDDLQLDRLPGGQVLTTCSLGGRGGRAADRLVELGMAAFSIDGGTKAWAAAGLPLVRGPLPDAATRPRRSLLRRRAR